jgi:hypothetical protein
MNQGIFSNYWWAWVASDYSGSIVLVGGLIIMILQILAVMHPGVASNKIICLIKGYIYGFPGFKKTTETSEVKTTDTTTTTSEIKAEEAVEKKDG